jgi:hypothetical protein
MTRVLPASLRPPAWRLALPGLLLLAGACAAEVPTAAAGAAWRTVPAAPGPTARHENAFVALDGRLYLVGGRGERPLEVFDPATGAWTAMAPPPQEIHHVQAVAHEGRLYLLGAFTGGFPDETPVAHVHIYEPVQGAWRLGPEIPEHRRRGAAGVAVHDGIFYLLGGATRGHQGGYVPWLDAFDPTTGEWAELADAPHARDHFHAAVLDGRLYAAGGRTSSFETGEGMPSVEAVDVYDIASGTWQTHEAPLPTPRSGNTTVAFDGRVLVIGGESESQERAHDEVEAFDPASGQWLRLPSLQVGRHGTQATVLDGAIHIAAGSGNRGGGPELDDLEVFDAPAVAR